MSFRSILDLSATAMLRSTRLLHEPRATSRTIAGTCAAGLVMMMTLSPAHAAPVTFTASGTINSVDAGLTSQFSNGQSFSVTVTYESSTPNNLFPTYGNYSNPILSYSGNIGSWLFSMNGGSQSTINIPQNYGMDIIAYGTQGWTSAPVGGLSIDYSDIFVFDPDGATPGGVFDNVALPASMPNSGGTFFIGFKNPGGNDKYVYGSFPAIASVSSSNNVPEPGSVSLLLAAGIALAGFGRRSASRRT